LSEIFIVFKNARHHVETGVITQNMANEDKKLPLDAGADRINTLEAPPKPKAKGVSKNSKAKARSKPKRTRTSRPYPASSFEEALKLAEAIQKIAPGGKVRRLTLCEQMKLSPTSSSTVMLITNSGRGRLA